MAKPKGVNQKAKWRAHSIRLARYADRVQSVYDTLNQEVAQIALKTDYDGSEPFKWNDYPATKNKIDEIRTQFVMDMRSVIYSGTSEEWKQSNLVQDLLADKALAFYGIKRNGKKARVYYQKNSDVLKAFQQRKDDGLNLSQKLWNQSADYKQEMEYCLSSAIEKGMSAVKLSKKLSKYLSDFPSLKKDYKEKYGKAVKCQDCEYRSIRLARSEINMAYRTAEQERWKQFDFVLGYEVKLTQNGRHVPDICDDLAGKYPKDFVFKGWHPNCYSDDSEVLTNHGWKFFKDVRYDDFVLSLNPLTRNVEWVEIMDMQCYESEGKMIHFHNKTLDCLVTQEHKMVYLNKSNGEIRMRQAKDYTQGMGGFYRGCNYDADDVASINIEGRIIPFDLFCEFMGYYLSDGSLQHNSGIIIAQKDGQPYKELMIDSVRRLGFEPKLSEEMITFYHTPLNRYLQRFGTAYNKFVPAEIKNASRRQIRIFMDAFVKCDGYIRKVKPFVGSHGNICIPKAMEKMYFTTSPQMAADLSELILKIGARPSFHVQKTSVAKKKDGSIIKGNYDCWVISECKSVTATVFDKEEVEYTGNVYDLSLTRNHIMYIRRNGKCFWGSNCMCYVIPILKTEEEFFYDEDVAEIVEPPKNFTEWLETNAERIDKAAENDTLPYWYTDNGRYVDTTRWKNWQKLLAYDEDANEKWLRVLKWKDSLGLDTSEFEAILHKDVQDWQYWGKLEKLIYKIDQEKERYYDAYEQTRHKIYSPEFRYEYGTDFSHKVRDKFKSLYSTLQYDAKMTWQQLQGIDDMINEYESYLTGSLVDVVKPSFTRKSAGFGAIGSDAERVRDQLNALVGTARKDHYRFLDFRDHFDHMATTSKMNDSMKLEFANLIDRDEGAVWKCIDHLNEMARATDLHKIPKRWYRVFNRYMEEIRSFDIETNGYGGVYNQIEGAYNIYKLSTHPAAIKYGLSKVSDKMPWNLFDVFAEQGIDMKYLPSSSFFRYEGEFVPWYDGIRANEKGTFNIYSSAHYDLTCKHVSINRAFFNQTNGRAAGNPFKAQQIFYHEYGHALDWQRDWRFKKKIGDVFDKYAAKYGDMDKDELNAKFWEALWKVTDKSEKYIKESVIDGAIDEQLTALSDVLQAMRKDGLKISGGHDDDYFMVRGKDGKLVLGKDGQPQFYRSSQLAEFIAHMNENFWLYNDVWEAFDAEFYKEVKSIMRKAYRGAANALD